ncbi:MAG: hypothetical protein QOF38_5133 [Pseudonocardiales bacterium]|jgi:hypothetical protein|nr:hypothetical protein [Pseudonocardiales bacterium]
MAFSLVHTVAGCGKIIHGINIARLIKSTLITKCSILPGSLDSMLLAALNFIRPGVLDFMLLVASDS